MTGWGARSNSFRPSNLPQLRTTLHDEIAGECLRGSTKRAKSRARVPFLARLFRRGAVALTISRMPARTAGGGDAHAAAIVSQVTRPERASPGGSLPAESAMRK